MRRKDLGVVHVDPGVYVLLGAEGDLEALVVQGPFPPTEDGQRTAGILGRQLSQRTGAEHSLVHVAPR